MCVSINRMQILWEQNGLERGLVHYGCSMLVLEEYRSRSLDPVLGLGLEPPRAGQALSSFLQSAQCGHQVIVLLSATGDSLPRCPQSYFDLFPSHGPILIDTEYFFFSQMDTNNGLKVQRKRQSWFLKQPRPFFPFMFSLLGSEWYNRRSFEIWQIWDGISVMARALEISLKLYYLPYKIGIIMPSWSFNEIKSHENLKSYANT